MEHALIWTSWSDDPQPSRRSAVRRALAALLGAAVGLTGLTATAAPAEAFPYITYQAPTELQPVPEGQTRTTVASVSMTPGSVTLVRQQGAKVTVDVRLTDPDPEGVRASQEILQDVPVACPCVHVGTADDVAGQHETGRLLELERVSGTAQDGVWRGSFLVGAGSRGDWRVASILTEDIARFSQEDFGGGWNMVDLGFLGVTSPTTTVVGSEEIVLGLTVPTTPGGPYIVRGRARYAGTGAPARQVRLVLAFFCTQYYIESCDTWKVTTDERGNFVHRVNGDPRGAWSVFFGQDAKGANRISGASKRSEWRRATLTLEDTPATVGLGEVITAKGTFGPAGADLRLQQKKSGKWLTVRTTPTISGDRYTFRLRPGGSGTKTYRVQVPSKARGWIGQNRTFSVEVG